MNYKAGLAFAGVVAAFLAFVGVMMLVCAGVGLVYQWNQAVGIVTGVVAVLVFFFVIGATADWSDD